MRKRILSACAALIFMTTATLSSYAEGEREYHDPQSGDKGTIGVTYSVEPTYTVEIPQKITLDKNNDVNDQNEPDDNKFCSIKVEDVNIPTGKAVAVDLVSATENYFHCVDDYGQQFALCVKLDTYVWGKGAPILEYELGVFRGSDTDPVPVYVGDTIGIFTEDGIVGLNFSSPHVYDSPDDDDDWYKNYAGKYSAVLTFGISLQEEVPHGQWI